MSQGAHYLRGKNVEGGTMSMGHNFSWGTMSLRHNVMGHNVLGHNIKVLNIIGHKVVTLPNHHVRLKYLQSMKLFGQTDILDLKQFKVRIGPINIDILSLAKCQLWA